MPGTGGIGSGLLLTPTTVEIVEHPAKMRARAKKNGYKNGTKWNSLASQVVFGILPTPLASFAMSEKMEMIRKRGKYNSKLEEAVAFLPTPTTQDAKNNGSQSQMERNSLPLNAVAGGRLNPEWVEWLMGYPTGWTDLKD